MKTQNTNNRLDFTKSSISELNDKQIKSVKGGASTYVCSNCVPDPISDKIREALSIADQGN